MRWAKKAAVPLAAAWALAGGSCAWADPVSAAPTVPLTSSKDDVSAALRASEAGARSVVDAFDADPAKDAAASAKANADRRAALAAMGLQSQQQQAQRQGTQMPSRLQGGSISELGSLGGIGGSGITGGGQPSRPGHDGAGTSPAVDPLKEAARPLYDEISKSGIADTMRGLKADLKAQLSGDKDKADDTSHSDGTANARPKESATPSTSTNTAAANDSSPAFNPPPNAAYQGTPRTPAEIERDRRLAAAGMETLIDSIKPWVIGFLVLASLAVAWRMTLRYLRTLEDRRRRRRFGNSRPPAQPVMRRRRSS